MHSSLRNGFKRTHASSIHGQYRPGQRGAPTWSSMVVVVGSGAATPSEPETAARNMYDALFIVTGLLTVKGVLI